MPADEQGMNDMPGNIKSGDDDGLRENDAEEGNFEDDADQTG